MRWKHASRHSQHDWKFPLGGVHMGNFTKKNSMSSRLVRSKVLFQTTALVVSWLPHHLSLNGLVLFSISYFSIYHYRMYKSFRKPVGKMGYLSKMNRFTGWCDFTGLENLTTKCPEISTSWRWICWSFGSTLGMGEFGTSVNIILNMSGIVLIDDIIYQDTTSKDVNPL